MGAGVWGVVVASLAKFPTSGKKVNIGDYRHFFDDEGDKMVFLGWQKAPFTHA